VGRPYSEKWDKEITGENSLYSRKGGLYEGKGRGNRVLLAEGEGRIASLGERKLGEGC